ncbi:MAG TPA: polysaccharide deacetylase family protein, partial [Polyangiaceae bacterium]
TSSLGGGGVDGGSTSSPGGNGGAAAGGSTSGNTSPVANAGASAIAVTSCGMPILGNAVVPKPVGAATKMTILDWAGWKGAVTYTFDDANSSQIANYPALNALGVHMTFYLQTNKAEAKNPIWAKAILDGHELGNHTQTHPQTGTEADVDAATTFIQTNFGVRPWTMASPYGDSSYVAIAKTRFLINRGVNNALIKPNDSSDPFNLPCYIPPEGAIADSTFNTMTDTAQTGGGWRVVLVHGFKGGSDGAYQAVDIAEFVAGVEHAKSLGTLWIDSMVNVGSYWRAQKLVSAVVPVADAAVKSWTWTLPANFPPGKCLRVTTDGGVLKQGDAAVPWNEHGFYEIALDRGSVTLAAQ